MEVVSKVRRVLLILSLAFLVILLKVWHLGVIQRDDKLLDAQKPQIRTVLHRASRGVISDRFGIPLALNRISYNATIYYAQIAEIPRASRKEYIRNLSQTLGNTLQMDSERIEDLIHSKASLFPHVPFLIKASLSEEEHARLRMLEKDWPGIYAEISSVRSYPLGKTGCHIIGTMGAINKKEYDSFRQELNELNQVVDLLEPVDLGRLQALKEKAYTLNDLVGKTGIEAQFESDLRGFCGKKIFEIDQKGRFVRELAGKEAVPGKEIVLSISSELQQFAESLLAQNEKIREGRSLGIDPIDNTRKSQKQPWIKGGAIVALDPKTGEVLALASYPRFDPNDFIFTPNSLFNDGKTKEVSRWLETDRMIGAIWDGLELLKRETPKLQEEALPLTWDFYLEQVLPQQGPLCNFFHKVNTVKGAIQFQEDVEAMLYFTKNGKPVPLDIQKRLDASQLTFSDQLFAADLCRIAVYAPAFTDTLIQQIGAMKLSEYRSLCQTFLKREAVLKRQAKEEFHNTIFKEWKELHQKTFLAEKRKEEKERKAYAKPYIDYLDQKEKELFAEYWNEKKWTLMTGMSEELMRTFREFSELKRPLLSSCKAGRLERDLAAGFYPKGGFGFTRSYAYACGSPQGSIFKLVTAYEALRQGKANLTIIDEWGKQGVSKSLSQVWYPRFYKGGRLPRSAKPQIGKIDLVGALEQTSNPYFSLLAGDFFNDPEDLGTAAQLFGFGEKTGIDLPKESRGNVPNDLSINRTGLYATAIGQHTLLSTPLQTACLLAAIANGGKLLTPKIVKETVGLTPDQSPLSPFAATSYLAQKELQILGIHFPLFTADQIQTPLSEIGSQPTLVRRLVPMEEKQRATLLEGMDRVVNGAKGSARPGAIRFLLSNPLVMREYLALQHQLVGKTGTAEILCNLSLNPTSTPLMYKHTWFGGISFTDAKKQDPDLVVVVFLRFGDFGKEAAPLAAQMIAKWRELKIRQ